MRSGESPLILQYNSYKYFIAPIYGATQLASSLSISLEKHHRTVRRNVGLPMRDRCISAKTLTLRLQVQYAIYMRRRIRCVYSNVQPNVQAHIPANVQATYRHTIDRNLRTELILFYRAFYLSVSTLTWLISSELQALPHQVQCSPTIVLKGGPSARPTSYAAVTSSIWPVITLINKECLLSSLQQGGYQAAMWRECEGEVVGLVE